MDRAEVVRLDKLRVWHPYTAMDAYADHDPLVIARAEGSVLFDADGTRYLDGNASWWTSALGHRHPRIVSAIARQLESLDHCALAGVTHEPAARLADELCAVAPSGLSRVFYTDNGSSAVEAAVKLCVQFHAQTGRPQKCRFLALDGAFHGDTIGAASLSGVELFRRPFAGVLFDCVRAPFPDRYEAAFRALAELLEASADTLAGVFIEPIVQGAAGMRMYDARFLRDLAALAKSRDVLLVCDEVFTGYGRTGPMWACDHAAITPDLMCVGKAFSGGVFPMAAVLTTDRVFDAFRGDKSKAFYYGHTYCGNPLGAAVAREVLAIYREEKVLEHATVSAGLIAAAFARLGELPGVARTRSRGVIGAADLELRPGGATGYLGSLGWRVYEEARRRGAYLRPLGDTVYTCPPLNMPHALLGELLEIIEASVRAAL